MEQVSFIALVIKPYFHHNGMLSETVLASYRNEENNQIYESNGHFVRKLNDLRFIYLLLKYTTAY